MDTGLDRVFDYVIVGAGSSGAILAARLSDDPETTVLLLETGPDYRAADAPEAMHSENPLGMMNADVFPTYQWPSLLVRRSTRQEAWTYDRGRGMGGSSAINWQVAHRAMLDDYDRWAEQGCVGWSGEELLPAMNRIENDLDFGDAFYHGNRGPITIYRPPIWQWGKVDQALLHAGLDLGYPWHSDLNAPDSTGISATPVNRSATGRLSTNDAYLEPARERANLTIHGDTHVDRVILDGKQVVGIRAWHQDQWVEFHGREIILAAGSVFSPPILMRSGIGPAEKLSALGIPVVADLPVGENLCDHAAVGVQLRLRQEAQARSWTERLLTCYIRYSSGLCGAGDNDMVFASRNLNGYNDASLDIGGMSVLAWQTFSRGTLQLADTDPFSMPVVDENMLSDERDLIRMRDGARRLFAIVAHPAIAQISEAITLSTRVTKSTSLTIADVQDDRALDEWMLETVRDTWHLVGTCRMGAEDDPRTVVDPDCRVLGIANLRVIDGSIMPEVPRANTNLTCMTIAEQMATRLTQG